MRSSIRPLSAVVGFVLFEAFPGTKNALSVAGFALGHGGEAGPALDDQIFPGREIEVGLRIDAAPVGIGGRVLSVAPSGPENPIGIHVLQAPTAFLAELALPGEGIDEIFVRELEGVLRVAITRNLSV